MLVQQTSTAYTVTDMEYPLKENGSIILQKRYSHSFDSTIALAWWNIPKHPILG